MAESSVKKPHGFFDNLLHHATEVESPATKIYVYSAPVRFWHWVTALCIVVLCVTGYLIGRPPPSVPGEASYQYWFGYIRMIHFGAGQILGVMFLYRVIYAIFGNSHARQIFIPPLWSGKWWGEVFHEIRWYSFLESRPKKYIGHNPLAQLAMFTIFVLPLINMLITGFALYAEGMGTDSGWYAAFGWVFTLYGDSFFVHTIHHLTMWIIICFATIHMYVAIREDIMSRQSMLSTMVSGWRYFKDDQE